MKLKTISVIFTTLIISLLASVDLSASAYLSPELDRSIAKRTADNDSVVSVVVFLEPSQNMNAAAKIGRDESLTRNQRIRGVVQRLQSGRSINQATIESYLFTHSTSIVEKHWIVPAYSATLPLASIAELREMIGVEEIIENVALSFDAPVSEQPAPDLASSVSTQHTLLNVGALWMRGLKGQGRLVCSFDTGVEEGHPALQSKWRGNSADLHSAWFSKVNPDSLPADRAGHGTHTMGVMVGSAGSDTIGVAPAAEWISAGIIDQGRPLGTTISDIIQAFQWTLNPDGDINTTNDVPDVILNSWGIPKGLFAPCDAAFWSVIDNVEAAGIVTIFAAGNEGPNPQSLRSPADRATTPYNSFAVGAVDDNQVIAGFSSRGPSSCDTTKIKPEVVAPGISIRSSFKGGAYQYMSGTSMAAPFIAGLVALMRQYNPDATVDQIKRALMLSCKDLGPIGKDNAYGFGLPDASRLIENLPVPANAQFSIVGSTVLGDGIAMPGENVSLTITLQNAAGNVEAVTGTLISNDTTQAAVSSPSASFLFGIGGTAALNLVPFQIHIDSNAANGSLVPLQIELTGTDGTPFDTLSFALTAGIAPVGTLATHETNRLQFTVSDFGQYGLAPHSCYNVGGVGLRYDQSQNLLYESGIIVGRNALQLASSVRNAQGNFTRSDFIPTQPLQESSTPDGETIQECAYTDGNAAISIPITLHQRTVSYDDNGEEGIILFTVYVKNNSLEKLTNLHFGFLADFDFGFSEAAQFNNDLSLLYQGSGNAFVGLAGLGNISGYQVIENGNQKRGFTNTDKFNLISYQGVSTNTGSTNDNLLLVSAGPFSIMPNDSVAVTFAVVAGNSVEELIAHTVAARNRMDIPTGTGDDNESLLPSEITLEQNYPNPFNPTTAIQFSLPVRSEVSLSIYNLLGQEVKTLHTGELPAGTHTRIWDGTNEANSGVASGIYFYRLTYDDQSTTKKMTLVR